MRVEPVRELRAGHAAGSQLQDNLFHFVHGCVQAVAIQYEECFQRSVTGALIAIQEGWFWMSENPSAAALSTRRSYRSTWLSHLWLCYGGLQAPQIAQARRTTRFIQDTPVHFQHFGARQIARHARRR